MRVSLGKSIFYPCFFSQLFGWLSPFKQKEIIWNGVGRMAETNRVKGKGHRVRSVSLHHDLLLSSWAMRLFQRRSLRHNFICPCLNAGIYFVRPTSRSHGELGIDWKQESHHQCDRSGWRVSGLGRYVIHLVISFLSVHPPHHRRPRLSIKQQKQRSEARPHRHRSSSTLHALTPPPTPIDAQAHPPLLKPPSCKVNYFKSTRLVFLFVFPLS